MQKESDTNANTESSVIEAPQVAATEAPKAEEPKGLSLRDALGVALDATKKEPKEEHVKADNSRRDKTNPQRPTKTIDERSAKSADAPKPGGADSGLEPPAEYTAEEKADFAQLSEMGKKAQLRLHKARQSKLEEIKREAAELQWAKDLAREATPFLKARGEKDAPHALIIKALKAVNELEGDPKKAALNYLKARGVDPKALLEEDKAPTIDPSILSPLQERLDRLERERLQEQQAKVTEVVNNAWVAFEGMKNAAGKPKFPDLDNSESGLALASQIGSLVNGQSELSRQFIASARARDPNLTYPTLFAAAYRYLGGKVDDAPAAKSQTPQNHIAQARRASASVPGSGATHTAASGKKFKTFREAAEAALAQLAQE